MKNDYQQNYVELYEGLYEEAILEGKTMDQAQSVAHDKVNFVKELIEGVCFTMEEGYYTDENGLPDENGNHFEEGSWYCGIRLSRLLSDISKFEELDEDSKKQALYNYGFDTNMPYRYKEGYHPVEDGPPVYGKFVEGSERLDQDWCMSARASMEAILEFQGIRHGREHKRDLELMSRQ